MANLKIDPSKWEVSDAVGKTFVTHITNTAPDSTTSRTLSGKVVVKVYGKDNTLLGTVEKPYTIKQSGVSFDLYKQDHKGNMSIAQANITPGTPYQINSSLPLCGNNFIIEDYIEEYESNSGTENILAFSRGVDETNSIIYLLKLQIKSGDISKLTCNNTGTEGTVRIISHTPTNKDPSNVHVELNLEDNYQYKQLDGTIAIMYNDQEVIRVTYTQNRGEIIVIMGTFGPSEDKKTFTKYLINRQFDTSGECKYTYPYNTTYSDLVELTFNSVKIMGRSSLGAFSLTNIMGEPILNKDHGYYINPDDVYIPVTTPETTDGGFKIVVPDYKQPTNSSMPASGPYVKGTFKLVCNILAEHINFTIPYTYQVIRKGIQTT